MISRIIRRLRGPLLVLAAAAAIAPASAAAVGDTPADYPGMPGNPTATRAPVVGDTPADYRGVSAAPRHDGNATATPAPVVGDTPADYPGMPGAPKYDGPATVEVVRPERTIVRDVDEVLPITLAALALLVALGGATYVLVRTRSSAPAGFGDSH